MANLKNIEMALINFIINWQRLWELKCFVKKDGFTLLDLGCGNGYFTNLANKDGLTAIGVDKSGSSSLHFIVSSIEKFETSQKFDAVALFHVLEHTENPLKILGIAASFLKENGALVIEIPLIGNLTEKFLGKDYFAYQDPSHRHFFTKKEIMTLLESAGFKIQKKGLTLLIFPITLLTTAFKQGIIKELLAILIFLPLKLLTILGFNEEIIRLYCRKYDKRK